MEYAKGDTKAAGMMITCFDGTPAAHTPQNRKAQRRRRGRMNTASYAQQQTDKMTAPKHKERVFLKPHEGACVNK